MRRFGFFAPLLAVIGLAQTPAAQAGKGLMLGGVDLSADSHYAYLGLIAKPTGNMGENGLLLRAWLENLGYQYERSATEIDARSWGGSLALGYQQNYSGGYITGFAGIAGRDTSESPDLPGQNSSGLGATAMLGLTHRLTPGMEAEANAQYSSRAKDYWLRGRLMFKFSGCSLGPEAIAQGNTDYSAWRGGLALSDIRLGAFIAGAAAGYEHRDSGAQSAYLSLGLALPF